MSADKETWQTYINRCQIVELFSHNEINKHIYVTNVINHSLGAWSLFFLWIFSQLSLVGNQGSITQAGRREGPCGGVGLTHWAAKSMVHQSARGIFSFYPNGKTKCPKKKFRKFIVYTILNHLTMEYWKITVAIFPSRPSKFPSELLKLPW